MLKEAAGVAGAALVFSPIGMPIVAHGLAGLLVGNLGLYVVDVFLKDIRGAIENAGLEAAENQGSTDDDRI
jgi:hypothetical protein